MNYIAYYRVSTKQQGSSGLGLEAQKTIVNQFINEGDRIISRYTDIESGNNNERKGLLAAINESNSTGATLLIAKLDRLSRNAAFIFTLRDSKVKFVCCDLPEANTLTIGIFATMAQHEREMISKRTKEALAAKKAAGIKLGNPNGFNASAQSKATQTKRQKAKNNVQSLKAKRMIKDIIDLARMRGETLTIKKVAEKLNGYGLTTTRGQSFTKSNVRYLLDRVLDGEPLPKAHQAAV